MNANANVCSITLNSRKDIELRGSKVFEVKRKREGSEIESVKIYEIEAIIKWLSNHKEYPHRVIPSQDEIKTLQEYDDTFVYNRGRTQNQDNESVNHIYFNLITPHVVNQFNSINVNITTRNERNNRSLKDEIQKIFSIYFDVNNFKNNKVFLYGYSFISFSEKRGFLRLTQSLYDKIKIIKLKRIYIDLHEEICCEFSVETNKRTQNKLTCSFNSNDILGINDNDIRNNENITFIYRCANPSLPELDEPENEKLIYLNEEGEIVFDKRDELNIKGFTELIRSQQQINEGLYGFLGGSRITHSYKSKNYKIRIGKQGGKYIIVNKKKIYIKNNNVLIT
jgi:hypothetical protein